MLRRWSCSRWYPAVIPLSRSLLVFRLASCVDCLSVCILELLAVGPPVGALAPFAFQFSDAPPSQPTIMLHLRSRPSRASASASPLSSFTSPGLASTSARPALSYSIFFSISHATWGPVPNRFVRVVKLYCISAVISDRFHPFRGVQDW